MVAKNEASNGSTDPHEERTEDKIDQIGSRDSQVDRHPAIGAEDAKLEGAERYFGMLAVVHIGKYVVEEAHLHLTHGRIIVVVEC